MVGNGGVPLAYEVHWATVWEVLAMKDLGLLIIRVVAGGLVAGHGAQKLFGSFGGYGLEGTAGWLSSLGLRPGRRWALAAGVGEFGSGLATALGFLHPIGPVGMLGPMSVATAKVHWGKPIWVTEGGAELPVVNIAVAVGLALTGPGRFSMDRLLGFRAPALLVGLAAASVAAGSVIASLQPGPEPGSAQADVAGAELQGGEWAAAPEAL